jgi:hypothetical protein
MSSKLTWGRQLPYPGAQTPILSNASGRLSIDLSLLHSAAFLEKVPFYDE